MFQRKIQLTETELLTLRRNNGWTNLSIKFNNTDVGAFTDKASLETGKWIPLPNGKSLLVRLVKQELEIWDGSNELVSGLKSGESDHYAEAWKALIAYGFLFLILEVISFSVNLFGFEKEGTVFLLLLGVVYVLLALWARKKYNKVPLYTALIINSIFCLTALLFGGFLPAIVLGVLLYYLIKGVSAKPLMASGIEEVTSSDLLDEDF
jgi:hypothetical protein